MIRLLSLIFLCLTLCGCDAEAGAAVPVSGNVPVFSDPAAQPEIQPLQDAQLEYSTGGAVTALSVNIPHVTGLRTFGEQLLLFSGDADTTLTVLEGEPLTATASLALSFSLSPEEPSLRMGKRELSYFDPVARETVVLSRRLQEIRRIRAPEDLVGVPILSDDGDQVFYCTSEGLRVWDLQSGIRRTLTEMPCREETLVGLHMDAAVVECVLSDGQKRFLSTADGSLIRETEGLTLGTCKDSYCAVFPSGAVQEIVFGREDQAPQALNLKDPALSAVFLEQLNEVAAISAREDDRPCFDVYDLSSGRRISSLTLPAPGRVLAVEDSSGGLWILAEHREQGIRLYRWDTQQLPCEDDTVYTGPYYTRENPDREGLARCREEADRLGKQYGIRIKIGEDAAAVQPWDYDLESEYLVRVLDDSLHTLAQQLAQYPDPMIPETAEHFSSLTICLVRSITGTAESGSLNIATGVQFLDGTDAYVVIAVGPHARQALYHELFHVMETHLLTHSIALDRWDQLNPAGFSYDYNYLSNATRDSGVYLQSENRAFIDTYSMSYPKEDRARIMEYAMLPGNEALFASPVLQAKLAALCDGIREAYRLENHTGELLWEQYLDK